MTTPELSNSQLSTLNSQLLLSAHQRRGKVARLPKTTRDRVNRLLLDPIGWGEGVRRSPKRENNPEPTGANRSSKNLETEKWGAEGR